MACCEGSEKQWEKVKVDPTRDNFGVAPHPLPKRGFLCVSGAMFTPLVIAEPMNTSTPPPHMIHIYIYIHV
jgi:hypothetical protein